MNIKNLLIIFLGPMISGIAQAEAPAFQVSVQTEKSTTMIVLTPPPQHHFNIKAPLSAHFVGQTKNMPLRIKTNAEVRFLVENNATTKDEAEYQTSAYLCDDANTYCEKKTVSGKMTLPTTKSKQSTAPPSALVTPPPSLAVPLAGFIYNDADKALSQAHLQNKPLLIDFYGIWCPPCNQLDNTVFTTPEFQKNSKKFINLKLDADHPASWSLKERYKIGGYPTVVFADSRGDEITRVVGVRDKTEFLKIQDHAWKRRTKPFATLKAKAAAADPDAAYEAGVIYLERAEFELAEPLLKQASNSWKSPPEKDPRFEKLWAARIGALKAKTELQDELLKTMNTAFESSLPGVFKLTTAADLAEMYSSMNRNDDEKKMQTKVISEAQYLLSHPQILKNEELKTTDVLQMMAAAQKTLGQEQQAKETFLTAVAQYKRELQALGPAAKTDRGLQLELAYCLSQAGLDGEAVMLYQRLQQSYPQEFTFYFGHARLLFQKKDLKNAETLAQKAFDYSYGDNRLRAALLLGQIYKTSGNDNQASALINKVLSQTVLPKDPFNRTHRYVKQLKNL